MNLNDFNEKDFISLFNRIYTTTGLKVPAEITNNSQLFKYLTDQIKANHGRTDHKEVQTAFEMYANNYLPIEIRTKTLTYVVFNQIMKSYHIKENSSYNRPDADEYIPTEAEKLEIIRKGLLREFENFGKYGMFFNAGNSTFEYLDKMGAFDSFDETKIKELKQKSKRDFESYKKMKSNPYMSVIGNGNTLEQVEGYNYVMQFFKDLRMIGVDMIGFLEENSISV